jgi:hypothetical protein
MVKDAETVTSTERILERSQGPQQLRGINAPELNPEVTITRIKNFICPACKEVIPEVVSVNGRVQGWCGNTHTYIREEM